MHPQVDSCSSRAAMQHGPIFTDGSGAVSADGGGSQYATMQSLSIAAVPRGSVLSPISENTNNCAGGIRTINNSRNATTTHTTGVPAASFCNSSAAVFATQAPPAFGEDEFKKVKLSNDKFGAAEEAMVDAALAADSTSADLEGQKEKNKGHAGPEEPKAKWYHATFHIVCAMVCLSLFKIARKTAIQYRQSSQLWKQDQPWSGVIAHPLGPDQRVIILAANIHICKSWHVDV